MYIDPPCFRRMNSTRLAVVETDVASRLAILERTHFTHLQLKSAPAHTGLKGPTDTNYQSRYLSDYLFGP